MAAECEELLPQDSPAASQVDIPGVFGATEEDANQLRIISLYEVQSPQLLRLDQC